MFVTVGRDETRSFSDDGREWSKPEPGEELLNLKSAVFGQGKLVALGSRGKDDFLQTSDNGKSWESKKMDTGYGGALSGVSFGNGTFIAFGGKGSARKNTAYISHSKDGLKWSEIMEITGDARIRRAAFGKDRWVGVGDYGRIAVCTGDLKKWDDVPDTKPIDTLIDVTYGNNVFVGVGLHGLRRWSADGKKWSEPEHGKEGEHLNSVSWTGNSFIAVGAGGSYASVDGKRWERKDNVNAPTFFSYDNGKFAGIAWKGRILYSEDAITWEEVLKSDTDFMAIASGQFA